MKGTLDCTQANSGTIACTVQVDLPHQNWTEVSIYTPVLPGVLVALAGLWISHWLTKKRERRKEIFELCALLKERVREAEHLCPCSKAMRGNVDVTFNVL